MHSFDKYLCTSVCLREHAKERMWISQRNILLMVCESERWRRWCWLALMAVAEQHNPSVWLSGVRKARSTSFHLFMPRLPVVMGEQWPQSFAKMNICRFWTCNMNRTWVDQSEKRHLYPTKVIRGSIEIENFNTSLSQYCICQTCLWLIDWLID